MKTKFIIISILMNILILSIIRGFISMNIACIVSILFYSTFTYFTFRQFKNQAFWQNLLIILLGAIIVHLPQRIIDFHSQLVSFPEFLCEIFGVLLGYLFYKFGNIVKISTVVLATIASVFLSNSYDKVLDWINYSNLFYKNTTQIQISSVPYLDSTNHQVNEQVFNTEKYIMLNIWATSCVACIAEFPQVDSLYALSQKTTDIQLYTACILTKQKTISPMNLVHKKNCTFPVLTIPNWELANKKYGMYEVPTTFVVKNKKILFRGSLLEAFKQVDIYRKS